MTTECTFCEIVGGQKNESTVYRDDEVTVFLDKRPLFWGHLLLVPNRHVATLGELSRGEIFPVFRMAQRLCRAAPQAVSAAGSFVAINNRVSQSVPHMHVHIVPRNFRDGLRGFFWPRKKYESELQMQRIALKIKEAIKADVKQFPDA